MKKIFSLTFVIVVVLILCCSCSAVGTKEINSEKSSQQQTEEQKQAQLLKDAELVADKFINAFFNAKYNESNALSCLDFKQQVEFSPDANLYYDGEKVIWGDKTFESTEKCLERIGEMFSSMSLQKCEIQDRTLLNAESFDDIVGQKEIPEVNLFSDSELSFNKCAIVNYSVVMQVEDTTPQGMQMETHEGTVSVLLLYANEQWKVYSPSIMGIFTGYVYFK